MTRVRNTGRKLPSSESTAAMSSLAFALRRSSNSSTFEPRSGASPRPHTREQPRSAIVAECRFALTRIRKDLSRSSVSIAQASSPNSSKKLMSFQSDPVQITSYNALSIHGAIVIPSSWSRCSNPVEQLMRSRHARIGSCFATMNITSKGNSVLLRAVPSGSSCTCLVPDSALFSVNFCLQPTAKGSYMVLRGWPRDGAVTMVADARKHHLIR